MDFEPLHRELVDFIKSLFFYLTHRLRRTGLNFERVKNFIVDILMVRRGANTSMFVHGSVIGLALAVLVGGGVLSSTSVVSGSYPGVRANPLVASSTTAGEDLGVISSTITPITIISEKPRDKVVDYKVKSGDTVSSIAREFEVTDETILWENNLSTNSKLKEGQSLRILPVPGVAHTVKSGDTIFSIAKTYRANAQAMIDFPFNDIGDDFALKTGATLIVPDGAPPEKAKPAPTQYLARGQKESYGTVDLGSSQFGWPASGLRAQYFSWYHPGIDISNLAGGPIRATDSGTVVISGWDSNGYGNTIVIDHGNGYTTRYAHMSALYASTGQKLAKGEVMGMMGSTGRSTGTHLHFEIRKSGSALNPLSVLGK
ncbi:MAG: M23 family metallopeptidase [Patescibacteria group bacterium]